MSHKIPFSPPRIDQKIIDEVVDTLKSGWITTGPKTKLFEKRLTEYTGAKATLCLNSATAGLEMMLRWFGVAEGDEVILPTYTYSATANVIIHCGAKPVFVDIGDDFNINVEAVRRAITVKTKVIIPVDFGGWPCDYDKVNSLVREEKIVSLFNPLTENQHKLGRILVLSDAAHSIGASYKGKKTGSLTDVSVFSFHAVKNITTAEGGAVSLNLPFPFDNNEIYTSLSIKTNHGQTKSAFARVNAGAWKYDIVEAGYKFNMTDIAASIGLVELERYERDTLIRRKTIANSYNRLLKKYEWAVIPVLKNNERESSYHLYPLRIKNVTEQQRDSIIETLALKGVAVNMHFIPVPMMTYYKGLNYDIADYPDTYRHYKAEISLPVFYDLSLAQIRAVVRALADAVEELNIDNPAEGSLSRYSESAMA
ncbi:MAG TPA: DegT/DnrJ/EryC1/StrS aminotransferase family protein [Mucilaginibacter sp.]|jgi:dTDP-4-amino-4,6-dideoxygalactose transaminase|nr:DegT/DnrJ/EryC1/StrS aminotransferase family protein [Mucilaginibacter sp.]